MSVKVSINFDLNRQARLAAFAVQDELSRLGKAFVAWIRENAPEDTGAYKAGINSVVIGNGEDLTTRAIVFGAALETPYVEQGRSPGKQPPPAAMLGWIQRHHLGGVAFNVKTHRQTVFAVRRIRSRMGGKLRTRKDSLLIHQKSIAFLIGRAIGRRGLPGFHLFARAVRERQDLIEETSARLGARITATFNGARE